MEPKENNKQLNIADSVMTEIDTGHIKMRPRIYFVLGMLALGIGLTITTLLGIWFVGITSYHFRHHDPLSFIALGQHGWMAFLRTFPFIPLLFALATVGIGIWLIRKYEISYKHSFIAIGVSIVFAIVASGYVVDAVGVNERLAEVQPMRMWYSDKSVGDEWLICEIGKMLVDKSTLMCRVPEGEYVEVRWDNSTMLPFGLDIDEGDVIRVVGEWNDDVFIASGIRKGHKVPMHFLRNVDEPCPTGTTKGWRLPPHSFYK